MLRRRNLRGTRIPERGRCEVTPGSWSIDDVKECARVCGSYWFEPDTMRFFKSRVGERIYPDGRGGAYFVSSEKGPHGPRAYSVRYYDPAKCNIDTVGEFQGYRTSTQAHKAAQRRAARAGGLSRRRRR